jgi:hypothetical protein
LSQFFIGSFEDSPSLLNDFLLVLLRNFTSISGFWFDCITSIPWSFIDFRAYTVRERTQSSTSPESEPRIPHLLFHAGTLGSTRPILVSRRNLEHIAPAFLDIAMLIVSIMRRLFFS